jgi:AcrR family transcriptional regulator
MADPVNPPSRAYHAPHRAAAAARTRESIVAAAKDVFERLGWSGGTMRAVADQAGVSVKTVEALYRTKAELLKTAVDYAIAGDLRSVPVLDRESVAAMQNAPDAPTMLGLHARHTRDINGRAAPIFWVVEQAASDSKDMAALWAQMTENRRTGVRWAAGGLLAKPGLAPHVTQRYAEEVFWVATDP